MCHILKKGDDVTYKTISDGCVAVGAYTVCAWTNKPKCKQTHTCIYTLNILFPQHKGIRPEMCQWQAPLNSWPGLAFWTAPADILSPSQDASLQASDSSARYPVVPLLCWPSHGRMGNKNREAEMPPVWLFKAPSPVCYAQRATSAAGWSERSALGSLCGCMHCTATTKRF